MTVTARWERRTGSSFMRATEASPSRKVRPTGLSMNRGVESAAMAVLHQPSERVTRLPGMSAWERKPERRSAVLVRSPCGRASRRLGLSSSSRVTSMGPTVIPRKKEILTFLSAGIMWVAW